MGDEPESGARSGVTELSSDSDSDGSVESDADPEGGAPSADEADPEPDPEASADADADGGGSDPSDPDGIGDGADRDGTAVASGDPDASRDGDAAAGTDDDEGETSDGEAAADEGESAAEKSAAARGWTDDGEVTADEESTADDETPPDEGTAGSTDAADPDVDPEGDGPVLDPPTSEDTVSDVDEYLEAEREHLDRREEELIAEDPFLDADAEGDAPPDGDEPLDAAESAAALESEVDPIDPPVERREDKFGVEEVPPGEPDPGSDPDPVGGGDDSLDDGLLGDGPEYDKEMPLADHIEEMVRRLGIVFAIGGFVTLLAFPLSDQLINFMWNSHIPGAATPGSRLRPRLYGPLELVLTELKVAGLSGLVVGLPMLVYQTYLFMKPGLYPKERRYYLAAVPTSLVLALVGIAFAHFIVLPTIFAYFTTYTQDAAVIAFGLKETFNLILLLMGYMAIVFQIPLFVMLAIMMNLVTRRWLEDKRLIFWGSFLGLSFLVSPDPTGMAPIIVAATMVALFEGTLALLRWTGN
ncbi:twin-arginine translocase subunit TatC [Halegenticoccus soli]|uniref:twin-arginine translocase subunit TatC n=1 Tax=Halegenticoccus soli TaxID=1985678 RepID=UPI000C6EAC6F|nr:twin-arginine translocase subunit TatC [Halegenticoccus soli]